MRKITVPTPRRLPSGDYNIWLAKEKVSVTASTPRKCEEQALAIRMGTAKQKRSEIPNGMLTLSEVIDDYIISRESVISPSTLCGYYDIKRNRFKSYMNEPIKDIDFQMMVNVESRSVSPKTVKNAWGLVSSALKYKNISVPAIRTPQDIPHELNWLDYEQILILIDKIRDTPCEFFTLLALHGLRKSEILAITPDKITEDAIKVNGSVVYGLNGFERKETNKNRSSNRTVPIMIPRLSELVATKDKSLFVFDKNYYQRINNICRENGLPEVGVHGLRRSFASLCYHLGLNEMQTMRLGGWTDFATMRKIYTKLSTQDAELGAAKLKDFFSNSEKIVKNSEN